MNLLMIGIWLLALALFLYTVTRSWGLIGRVKDYNATEAAATYNRHSLYQRLPFLDLVDQNGTGVVVRKDGSFAAGFRIAGIDSFYFDPTELNELSYRKEGLFRKIPVDDNLKVSYFYRIRHDVSGAIADFYSTVHPGADPVTRFLNGNYRRFLEENNTDRKFRRVESLFILQYRSDDPWERGGLFLFGRQFGENLLSMGLRRFFQALAAAWPMLAKKAIVQRRRAAHEKKMALFEARLEEFREALADVYEREPHHVTPLSAAEVEKILFEDLNPGLRYDGTRRAAGDHTTDRFYQTDIFNNLRYVNVGGQLRSVLTLRSWPKVAAPCALRHLYKENWDMDIIMHYKNPSQARKRRAVVLREKAQKQSLIDPRGLKTGALSASRAVGEAEEILDELERGDKWMGEMEIQFVVYSPEIAHNLEELQAAEKTLASHLRALDSRLRSLQGITTYREDVAALDYVLGNLPFLTAVENSGRTLDGLSSWAAKLLPDENLCPREDLRAAKVLLVTERQELYGLDPFSQTLVPNYNFLIAGAPGTGKSVFARKLLSRFLYKQPLRILTITRGDDWNDFFTAIGGATIQIDTDHGRVLNLFDCPGQAPSESFKRTLIAVLLFMGREEDDSINSVMLSLALDELYRKARVVGFRPRMSDFRDTLESFQHDQKSVEDRAQTFAVKLTNFCEGGEYGKLFDTFTHEDFYARASSLCFDLDKLGRDSFLETVYAIVLPAFIDAQVQAKDRATLVIYDECWAFLKNPALRGVVETNFRTARKFHSGIFALTQNYEDFRKDGAFIYDTTATKVILRQEKGLDFLKESLHLSDAETARVAALPGTPQHYSEYLLVHGAEKVFIRDYSTEFDIVAFGSKRDQIERRRAALAHGDPVEAIYQLARGGEGPPTAAENPSTH